MACLGRTKQPVRPFTSFHKLIEPTDWITLLLRPIFYNFTPAKKNLPHV
jgi:hypothetical protein